MFKLPAENTASIMWMLTADAAGQYRGNNNVTEIDEDTGDEVILERLPSIGHTGGDLGYQTREKHPLAQLRYLEVCTNAGHTVHCVLSSASSDLDAQRFWDPSGMAQTQLRKNYFHGWFQWNGTCLARDVKTGGVRKEKLVDKTIATSHVCPAESLRPDKPCKHAIAERNARMAKNAAKMHDIERVQLEADTRVEANTAAIIAKAVANALATNLAAKDKA